MKLETIEGTPNGVSFFGTGCKTLGSASSHAKGFYETIEEYSAAMRVIVGRAFITELGARAGSYAARWRLQRAAGRKRHGA